MNIAIEDIKYLERKYGEKSCEGDVWRLAQEGKYPYEIEILMQEIYDKAKLVTS